MAGPQTDSAIPRGWRWAEKLTIPLLLGALVRANAGRPPDLVERRIDYGDDPAQHLLLVTPEDPAAFGVRAPVFFVHGGSWRSGSPEGFRAIGRFFARRGHPTVLAGYRLVPDATFPAQRDDVLAALTAALPALGTPVDDAPVILAGQSAGAQLAALAAYDRTSRHAYGIPDERIGGLLCVSGPLDFSALCPEDALCPIIRALMGGVDDWSEADPAYFVQGDEPWPVLLVHGARDPLVPVVVAASFVERVRKLSADNSDVPEPSLVIEARRYHSELVRIFLDGMDSTRVIEEWLAER